MSLEWVRVMLGVKLPALPRGAPVAKPSGTAPKPPVFALRATPRSPVAIPPRASARGILAKASGEVDGEENKNET
jgi:hypothetical protein